MRVSVLGSGSSGNATVISSSTTCVLVDLGFGPRSLRRRVKEAGLGDLEVDAILVTHGHSDHVSGIPAFLASRRVPVFMNEGTRQEVACLEGIDSWEVFETGRPWTVGDLTIEAFPIPHDAAQPVGFRISGQGLSGVVSTDLGSLTPGVAARLDRCDYLVLESNHDEEMLKVGPYPWLLKQRVLGRNGHLSNRALADFLLHEFDGHCRHIFLAHLSQQNNHPQLALESARRALMARPNSLFESCRLHLTDQVKPTIVLNL